MGTTPRWIAETAREVLRRERTKRSWSQADVAQRLSELGLGGIYPTTVAKIESGERQVKLEEAVAIADLLEVPLDVLVGRSATSTRAIGLHSVLRVLDCATESRAAVEEACDALMTALAHSDSDDIGGHAAEVGEQAVSSLREAADELRTMQNHLRDRLDVFGSPMA